MNSYFNLNLMVVKENRPYQLNVPVGVPFEEAFGVLDEMKVKLQEMQKSAEEEAKKKEKESESKSEEAPSEDKDEKSE